MTLSGVELVDVCAHITREHKKRDNDVSLYEADLRSTRVPDFWIGMLVERYRRERDDRHARLERERIAALPWWKRRFA